MGLTCPIIREGDNLAAIVVESVLDAIRMPNNKFDICDRAVVGITESVVARSQGNAARREGHRHRQGDGRAGREDCVGLFLS